MTANFSPGPSQLYFTTEDHTRTAFRQGIPSLSHRSKKFEQFYQHTQEQLRELLSIPSSHHIFFTASATEIWERIIQNLVAEKSTHFVNGAFSEKFFKAALQLNRNAKDITVADGDGFVAPVKVDGEIIALTHNETSTGVSLPLDFIYGMKELNPSALVCVDAVSSIPFVDFDYGKVDSVYFSVQKGFGMPPGLGVWIVNENCIAKSEQLLSQGHSVGTYHSLPSYLANGKKNQTPETPNSVAIYVLGKIAEDMNRRGINVIRKETLYKSTILYQALQSHKKISSFVKKKEYQSPTVVIADCGEQTSFLAQHLNSEGLDPGEGYGRHKSTQLRFANFPAHSKEQFELLVDTLNSF
ncbi:MAG TPA: aminotransferase class V-fold PLP-dependent enzyme [Cyclobacteriaceae bacterium]|nr:aminotransferase class V-fold PLP-dependent enzyme [Cyclobacteriaceae bacterium]